MAKIFEFSAPVTSLSELCRLCGEVDSCINVFDESSQDQKLLEKIEIAIQISIAPNDNLPKGLCSLCLVKLNEFSSFLQQCHDTQERLIEFLSIQSALHPTNDDEYSDSVEKNYVNFYEDEDNADELHSIIEDDQELEKEKDEEVKVCLMVTQQKIPDPKLQLEKVAVMNKDKRSFSAAIIEANRGPVAQFPSVADGQGETRDVSDVSHMEHSYCKESSPETDAESSDHEVSTPLSIRKAIPIKTVPSCSESKLQSMKPGMFNVTTISPTSPPPLVPINRPRNKGKVFVMNKDKAEAGSTGKAYITNSDKTIAAELVASEQQLMTVAIDSLSSLVCEKAENGVSILRKGISGYRSKIAVSKGLKRKFKASHETIPYLVLNDGSLVKLEDVENEIAFEDIPVPPMILFHTRKPGMKPPSVILTNSEERGPSLSSAAQEPCPDLETPSGLLVEPYPDGCALPFFAAPAQHKVNENVLCTTDDEVTIIMNLGAPVSTVEGDTKFVVVRTNTFKGENKKKRESKGKASISERKKNRVPHCPELMEYLEFIPGKRPHARCRVCRAVYQSVKQCEYHIRSKHLSQACVFACHVCDKKFATNFLRKQHLFHAHDKTPNFMCSICGATFRTKSVLRAHELRHSASNPPIICELCGKGFFRKSNYLKHKTDVHLEKTAECNICGESFPTVHRLNEHLVIHNNGWMCKVCGAIFQHRNTLKIHMLTHGKSSSPKCDQCGKKCSTLEALHHHKESLCNG